MELFSTRLREIREKMGMTQKAFSGLLGVKQQTYSGYENNRIKPPMDVLLAIAKKCNVSLDWLCGLNDVSTAGEEFYKKKPRKLIDIIKAIVEVIISANAAIELDTMNTADWGFIDVINIKISQDCLIDFLTRFDKMYRLYKEETISESMFSDWIMGTIRKYEGIVINDGNVFSEFEDFEEIEDDESGSR